MKTGIGTDTLRGILALSGVVTLAFIMYVVIWINTLIKIWHAEFQEPKDKQLWFLFVLVLSPIGMPLYLILNRNRRAEKSDAAGKGRDRLDQQARDAQGRRTGMSDEDRARELARLLEMRENGVLSKDEFDKAKKRLSE
jgi:hypothetical protein